MDNKTNNNLRQLGYSLYSINKYAKNCRDGVFQSKEKSLEDEQEEMKYLYKIKEEVLKHFSPIQLHKQNIMSFANDKVFEGDKDYSKIKSKAKLLQDYNTGLYKKYKAKKCKIFKIQYYLYYDIEGFKFHIPIDEKDIKDYNNLQVKSLPGNFMVDSLSPAYLLDKDVAINNLLKFLT